MNLSETAFLYPEGPAIAALVHAHGRGRPLRPRHAGQRPRALGDGARRREGRRASTRAAASCRRSAGAWIELDFPAEAGAAGAAPRAARRAGRRRALRRPQPFDYLVEVEAERSSAALAPDLRLLAPSRSGGVIVTSRSAGPGTISSPASSPRLRGSTRTRSPDRPIALGPLWGRGWARTSWSATRRRRGEGWCACAWPAIVSTWAARRLRSCAANSSKMVASNGRQEGGIAREDIDPPVLGECSRSRLGSGELGPGQRSPAGLPRRQVLRHESLAWCARPLRLLARRQREPILRRRAVGRPTRSFPISRRTGPSASTGCSPSFRKCASATRCATISSYRTSSAGWSLVFTRFNDRKPRGFGLSIQDRARPWSPARPASGSSTS